MMFNRTVLWLVCLMLWNGCAKPSDPGGSSDPDDLDNPEIPWVGGELVSIQYLKSFYPGRPFTFTEDLTLRGTVISSDYYGNTRYSLFVEDDSGGIEIKIGFTESYFRFNIGQTVMIRCSGLTLGSYGGSLQLGTASTDERYETGYLSEQQAAEQIVLYGLDVEPIRGTVLAPSDFSSRYVGCLVRLDGVQFIDTEVGLPWSDGEGYTERHLEYCGSTVLIPVRVSSSALFAGYRLPFGKGIIEGILTYFNGTFSLLPVDDNRLLMEDPRCS